MNEEKRGRVIKIDPDSLVANAGVFTRLAVVIEAGAPTGSGRGGGLGAMPVYMVDGVRVESADAALELLGARAKKPLRRGRVRKI